MQIISSDYDFSRESTSRYKEAVDAALDGKVVRLTRQADFPDARVKNVQSTITNLIRKAGKQAKTKIESDDAIVFTAVRRSPNGAGRNTGAAHQQRGPVRA